MSKTTKTEIIGIIEQFGNVKTQADALTKEANGYKDTIKSYMAEKEVDELSTENFRVKYSVATSRDFNQEKLLAKLKELGATDCIKTVEVVDMNNLENAIYNKKIDASLLADCEVVTETPKLNLYKVKK